MKTAVLPHPDHSLIRYTAYVATNHVGWLDGNMVNFDTSKTDAFYSTYMSDYDIDYFGGSSWNACVGGYDEGCIHKLILYPRH